MTDNLPALAPNDSGEFLLYQTDDGRTRIDVRLEGDTVWLTQAAMAELFQTTPQNITLHINGIYDEGELAEAATCKEYLQVRREGERRVQRSLKHYSLEMILAVGCRVRSHRGTEFCKYLVGWTLRTIQNECDSADIACDEGYDPRVRGERRTLVLQYYHTLDFTKPADVKKVLRAFEGILNTESERMQQPHAIGQFGDHHTKPGETSESVRRSRQGWQDERPIHTPRPARRRRGNLARRLPV